LAAQDSLAARIAEYRPLAIVSLLISIKSIVLRQSQPVAPPNASPCRFPVLGSKRA
jgi:hypothetical protein